MFRLWGIVFFLCGVYEGNSISSIGGGFSGGIGGGFVVVTKSKATTTVKVTSTTTPSPAPKNARPPSTAIGAVFTRWGSRVCPEHTTKLYDGVMAGPSDVNKGGGTSFLCMHPDPQYPSGYSDTQYRSSNHLFGVQYANLGKKLAGTKKPKFGQKTDDPKRNDPKRNDAAKKKGQHDAACAVCQHNTAISVYVQWGRMSCSNGHITQYSGFVMASRYNEYKTESICVDLARETHSTTSANTGKQGTSSKLYPSKFIGLGPTPAKKSEASTTTRPYPSHREVACAVCSPPDVPAPSACQNFPGWTDVYGDDCSTSYYSVGCVPHQTVKHANKSGVAAKHACCACGGGTRPAIAPTPAPGPVVFTHWGSRRCPSTSTRLYTGFMVSSSVDDSGGGTTQLCLHPQPQYPPESSDEVLNNVNKLYRSVYDESGNAAATSVRGGEAVCAVCEDKSITSVYVQWGRVNCSHGHRTQYSGLVMSGHHSSRGASDSVCVDHAREMRLSQDGKKVLNLNPNSRLYLTEMHAANSDSLRYPKHREVACAVCSPVNAARVFTSWGARTCPSSHHTKLYDSFMAGPHYMATATTRGGTVSFLCMHPDPQYPAHYSDKPSSGNRLYDVEYHRLPERYKDAACVVCVDNSGIAPAYVQWGRVQCSDGHTTQYSGSIMSNANSPSAFTSYHASKSVCVDDQHAPHAKSVRYRGKDIGRLFYTEVNTGAAHVVGYPVGREVACAVCSPNNNTVYICGEPGKNQKFKEGKDRDTQCIRCAKECFDNEEPKTCGPLGPGMKYRTGMQSTANCTACSDSCFEAISWEKHENAYCLGKLSTTVYHSFLNATSACEQYGPSVCTGVYAIKCGMNKHYLCKAYFDYAPGNVYAPGVCLYTRKTTQTCGPPPKGKKFSSTKYTSSYPCTNCATCFRDKTCGFAPSFYKYKDKKTRMSKCDDCLSECFEFDLTWKKNTNRKCVKNYGSSNSSANAQKKCREDGPSKCMGVYDSDCDNKGDFYLCEAGYSLRYSRGHCTYTPPVKCKPGQYLTPTGQYRILTCMNCPSGKYGDIYGTTTRCKLCPSGRYLNRPAGTSVEQCSLCIPGTYTYSSERRECKNCGAGRYSSRAGMSSASQCSLCPPGRFNSETGITSESRCAKCPKGRYGRWMGMSAPNLCPECPRGQYGPSLGARVCMRCKKGRYQAQFGQESVDTCLACPAGQYGTETGAYSCTKCPAGRYSGSAATSCLACPPGRRSTEGKAWSCDPCNTCPRNLYQNGCFCREGTVQLQGGAGPWEGRVGVYTLGMWRPVCAHGFNPHAAALVCQSMGYPARGFVSTAFGRGTGARRSLLCSANTTDLADCSTGTGPDSCPLTSDDAGVICCEKNCDPKPSLQISGSCHNGTYSRLDPTSTRSSHRFYSDVTKLFLYQCFARPPSTTTQAVGTSSSAPVSPSHQTKLMWVLALQDAPNKLGQCPLKTHGVVASKEQVWVNTSLPPSGEWTLLCDSKLKKQKVHVWSEGNVRLVDGGQPFQGRLEIFHAGQWGSVCNTLLSEVETSLACASVNPKFNMGAVIKPFPRSNTFGDERERIWMDGVRCKGTEPSFHACKSLGWGYHNCKRGQEVGLVCRVCRPDLCMNQDLADCHLHGCTALSLKSRNLKGEIPNKFMWKNLRSLDLSYNFLQGTLPHNMSSWPDLHHLDVEHNQITGTLSPLWGKMSQFEFFSIANNLMNGSIPHSFGSLRNLKVLSLDENKLDGTLPASLGSLRGLLRLQVAHNALTGTVPSNFDSFDQLNSGTMSGNNLTGSIPTRLAFAGVEVGKTCHPYSRGRMINGVGSAGRPWCFTNSVCELTCEPDCIVAKGQPDRLKCFQDETWALGAREFNIQCIGKPCTKPIILSETLRKQKASVTHCSGTASGKTCSMVCPPNHVIHTKAPSFECSRGRWQDLTEDQESFLQCLPTCGKAIKANMLEPFTVDNADLSMCNGIASANEDVTGICNFKCDKGHYIAKPGKPQIKCVDGLWRKTLQTRDCTQKPCLIKELPEQIVKRLSFPPECETTQSNQVCAYKCKNPGAQLPHPSHPTIACSNGTWVLGNFGDQIRCVSACIDPPDKSLLKNAKMEMCRRMPALNPTFNFNGSCTFECDKGMSVQKDSGKDNIRCESPASGGPPKWVKLGDTGKCTSDLCALGSKHNVIEVHNFAKHLWEDMYVPENVDKPNTDMLMSWDECIDGKHKFLGTQRFRIGCCQKEVETANGTMDIASGLFPLNASGICPPKDNWIKYMDTFDSYHCVEIGKTSPYVYVALAVVTIVGVLSGALVVLTKLLFGRKDIYKKVQSVQRKISILASTRAGRQMLSQLSAQYKTTNSFKRGIESEQKKHLSHAEKAIQNFELFQTKAKLTKQSSIKIKNKAVVPLCTLEDQQRASITQTHDPAGSSDATNSQMNPSVTMEIALVAVGPKRKHPPTDTNPDDGMSRVKALHEEAERLREKNAARMIQRKLSGQIKKKRFAKRSSLSRSATKVRQRISGAVKSKIKKYKQMMAGGYISINYSMMLPIFLATLDLFSDVMFIYRLSNSQYIFGRVFLVAALAVLCSSIFFNSIAFFGIFIYSHKRDKVADDVWKELMCPWLMLIAIASLTHIGLTVLLPWRDREHGAHPTKCSYLVCSVLGYYEAFGQLCVGILWLVWTKNFDDPFTMVSVGFSSLVLVTGFYRTVLQAVLTSKLDAEKKAREEKEHQKEVTLEELKASNAQKDQAIQKLQDELRVARILADNEDPDTAKLLAIDVGLTSS